MIIVDRVASQLLNPVGLTLLGGRPSMGTTALLLAISRMLAVDRCLPVAYVSCGHEQDARPRLALACAKARIPLRRAQAYDLSTAEWRQLRAALDRLEGAPLFWSAYSPDHGASIEQHIEEELSFSQDRVELIVVDGLGGLLPRSSPSPGRALTSAAQSLKRLSDRLDTPILAATHLVRNTERQPGSRPRLSNVRRYWARIDAVADAVWLVYRRAYYQPEIDSPLEVVVAKGPGTGAIVEVALRPAPGTVRARVPQQGSTTLVR